MPYTVNTSFQTFRANFVDLDVGDVAKARTSRDALKNQLALLPQKVAGFPSLYGGCLDFGSFARRTRVRPLNDIDMLLLLNGRNTESVYFSDYTYRLRINDQSSILMQYTNNDQYINSTKILNKLKSSLSFVSYYRKADIKRTGVAVVLDLSSYPWVFDVVPAFPIRDGMGGISHYLIPNGTGNWMKTDPRKDQSAITAANQLHNGNLLSLMRIMKYWNSHYYAIPTLPSYYFETMLISAFKYKPAIVDVKASIVPAFEQIAALILSSCPDPKGLGSNLDSGISWEIKTKVQSKAKEMAQFGRYALSCEQQGNHEEAIKWWKFIFYPDFPAYG